MNIIGIVGSLRNDSIHRQIFNHYREIAKDQFELVEGVIDGIPLYDGENMGNPEVAELAARIIAADGVIFFSPEYNYSIPGALKNAIDWLSRLDPQPLAGKPATIIGASPGNVGTARMQYHLRQVGVFLDINFMNKPEVMISGSATKLSKGRIIDSATVDFLRGHAQTFAEFSVHSRHQ